MDVREFIMVILPSPLPIGYEFIKWPPHITLVPWFESDNGKEIAMVASQRVAPKHEIFKVRVGLTAFFGPRNTVEVNLIEPSEHLQNMHQELTNELKGRDVTPVNPHYMRENYHPHITKKTNRIIETGAIVVVSHIYTIEAPITNRISSTKKVITKVPLRRG